MRRLIYIGICIAGTLIMFGKTSFAQTGEDEEYKITRILFMLDASQSMGTAWGKHSKISIAKSVLREVVDSLRSVENVQLALRVYGHQKHYTYNDCKDTRLEVGFRHNSHILIDAKLTEIKPNGITPIAYSLEKVEGDFPSDPDSRNIVIIITDGEESCKGDPCAVSRAMQAKGVILKPFVVGLGYQSELRTNLDCIGSYYEANTPEEFKRVINEIIVRVLDKTTVQVNLNDIYGNPTETNVNLTFYNPVSQKAAYNYYHTLNTRGNPDTMDVDPINTYHLMVHTIPPVIKKNVNLEPNRHNTVVQPAPQGYMDVKMSNSNQRYNSNIQCLVLQPEPQKTVNVQPINTKEKYLTGRYHMEILTLPRISVPDLEINQTETTTIQIPEPGLVTINSKTEVYGGIFLINEENEAEKVYTLNDRILKESILLQPGNYIVVYRDKVKRNAHHTVNKQFTIRSGQSTTLNL